MNVRRASALKSWIGHVAWVGYGVVSPKGGEEEG